MDPDVEVRETRNQIDDLMNEIRMRVDRNERTLVTTLTKKMSEDLTDYLLEMGFKVRYLHSEIDTLERIQIIRELRLGEYDVLVGVNLLREGLDLPEVSLIGDPRRRQGGLPARRDLADPDDRPRGAQHRAARSSCTPTRRPRRCAPRSRRPTAAARSSVAYNEEHGITPETIVKGISDISEFLMSDSKVPTKRRRRREKKTDMKPAEIETTIVELEEEMLAAAEELRFEYAAKLRDEIRELRRELDAAATPADAARRRRRAPVAFRRMQRIAFRIPAERARGRPGRVLPLLPGGIVERPVGEDVVESRRVGAALPGPERCGPRRPRR